MVRNLTVALAPDDFKAADELGPQVRLCPKPLHTEGSHVHFGHVQLCIARFSGPAL